MRKKYDVFISCKSEDYSLGRQIYDFLSNKGKAVFLADKNLRKLGISDYGRVIDDAIDGSTHMLVVSSSDEYIMRDTSPYVYYEWHTFSEEIKSGRKQGNLMTVLTEQSLMPKLPIALRNNQSFLFSQFTDVLPYINDGIELTEPTDGPSQPVNTSVNSITKETTYEQKDWDGLDAKDYEAQLDFKRKYPQSEHMDQLDDMMWQHAIVRLSVSSLNRYLNDWPAGRHTVDAKRVIDDFSEWERVMRSKDLFEVSDFRSTHLGLPFVDALYYKLRDEELAKMKENPTYYDKDELEQLLNAGIFTKWELIDEGIMTEDSWKKMYYDLTLLSNICDLMIENPNVQTAQDSTDVFFFGMPGAGGKTCLLMSLAGNNGKGYFMKTTDNAGKYAAGLSQYYKEGQLPDRTFGRYWAAIETVIQTENSNHKVNFVEMSGEEFIHISDNPEVSFENIGTSVCKLLRNDNRKIFFLHFDPTLEKIKLDAIEPMYDGNGEIIDERIKTKYVYGETVLSMFLSKLLAPENAQTMRHVDAIHILVPKADILGERPQREEKAKMIIEQRYQTLREGIWHCCKHYKIRNEPEIIPFSIGTFYIGRVFEPDPTDTLSLIDVIKDDIDKTQNVTIWQRIRHRFRN